MKAIVVFDSVFGNTGQVARAIGEALGSSEEVEILQVGEVQPEQLAGLTLLIVGSPTRQFSPTGATTNLLKSIPKDGLKGVKVAAFDTRFTVEEIEKVRILAFFASRSLAMPPSRSPTGSRKRVASLPLRQRDSM